MALQLDLPVLASVNWQALAISVAALVAILRFGAGMLLTLAACSLAGVALHLLA